MPGHATDAQLGFQWFGICVGICPEAVNLKIIANFVDASSSSMKQLTTNNQQQQQQQQQQQTSYIIHHHHTSYIIHHHHYVAITTTCLNLRFPHGNHRPCRGPGAGFPPSSFPSGHPAAGHHEMAASHGWHLIGLDRRGLVRVLR